MYVPILKWRQGEYLALERLPNDVKECVMPLIEVPPLEWDFEKGQYAKNIDEHLKLFITRFIKKWGKRKAFIDLHLIDPTSRMVNGVHPLTYVFVEALKNELEVIPVTGLNRGTDYQRAVKKSIGQFSNGVCLRLSINDVLKLSQMNRLDTFMHYHSIEFSELDVVLDLEAPDFNPITQFARLLHNQIQNLSEIERVRSFTIIGSAFPKSMGQLSIGAQIIERSEWNLYREYCGQLTASERKPQFGDYAISNPALLQLDMRLIKPAASLRYTIDGGWYIHKGTNVRDNGFSQYKKICLKLMKSRHFQGGTYSPGDKYIKECGEGAASTGNLTVWRWVGTNHHITKVVDDSANFGVL